MSKYGDDVSVKFDNSVTYSKSGEKGFLANISRLFAPDTPNSLEEFTAGIDMIKFNVKINGDACEIVFEKNSTGELVVSSLTQIEQ